MRTTYKGIACGDIDPLPGSSQVAVFHSAFVLPKYRNQGYGYEAHKDRLEQAEKLLYDYSLCTVAQTNEFQIANLEKAGWKLIDTFWSNKTSHYVCIYGKQLNV